MSPKNTPQAFPLAVIGGGNMGRAILLGGLDAGVLAPGLVVVAEPDQSKHEALASRGVRVVASPTAAVDAALSMRDGSARDGGFQLLLAVKPQTLNGVAEELRSPLAGVGPVVVISILAGTPTSRIRDALGERVRVVRAMPNLPASLGRGATGLCAGAGASEGDAEFASRLFGAVGPLVLRCEEGMMDAFTAVAGSGPAYLFYLAEAMIGGATAVGFTSDEARRIVAQTLVGAAALLGASPDEPASLRAAVTSKGGTTAAATRVLDERAVMKAWEDAIVAARDRGRELGRA